MAEMLIPIKEFPRCCGRCPCFHAENPMYCQADKTIKMTAPYGMRMGGCPAVEIKTPHGDLIERSLALGACYEMERSLDMEGAFEVIENAPTVLEATE